IVGEADFRRQSRARMTGRDRGIARVYAERSSGRLVGATMCVPDGEHMAHLLALAVGQGLTVADMLRMPIYHPVLEEGLRGAFRDLAKQLAGAGESDLAACEGLQAEALD